MQKIEKKQSTSSNTSDDVFEKKPNTFVDVVIFSIIDNNLHVMLAKRSIEPCINQWSLIGGYIDIEKDANIEDCAKRKLYEKTGVKTPYLEQFCTFGSKNRDPRGWSISVIYFALIPQEKIKTQPGNGASDIKWEKITSDKIKEKLAFDHNVILSSCVKRLRNKVLYSSLPVYFMKNKFTLVELQKVYEIILDKEIDTKSFRRRILNADIIKKTNEMAYGTTRPAQLYQLKNSEIPYFFMRTLEG